MAQRYVIVGASLAGATAAITLREEGADGTVTLIQERSGGRYARGQKRSAWRALGQTRRHVHAGHEC
jgi:glycine/D-amino acid oxidase-like deaminating enzyme